MAPVGITVLAGIIPPLVSFRCPEERSVSWSFQGGRPRLCQQQGRLGDSQVTVNYGTGLDITLVKTEVGLYHLVTRAWYVRDVGGGHRRARTACHILHIILTIFLLTCPLHRLTDMSFTSPYWHVLYIALPTCPLHRLTDMSFTSPYWHVLYIALPTCPLHRLTDMSFTSSYWRVLYIALLTCPLHRLTDMSFTSSYRHVLYIVLPTCPLHRLTDMSCTSPYRHVLYIVLPTCPLHRLTDVSFT